jgi:hypothetical protein
MSIDQIQKRFVQAHCRICRDLNSGRVVLTDPRGFRHGFPSYAAAYRQYFGANV